MKKMYPITIPLTGLYNWTFSHTGPEDLEIIYVQAPKKIHIKYLPKKKQ